MSYPIRDCSLSLYKPCRFEIHHQFFEIFWFLVLPLSTKRTIKASPPKSCSKVKVFCPKNCFQLFLILIIFVPWQIKSSFISYKNTINKTRKVSAERVRRMLGQNILIESMLDRLVIKTGDQ